MSVEGRGGGGWSDEVRWVEVTEERKCPERVGSEGSDWRR